MNVCGNISILLISLGRAKLSRDVLGVGGGET